MKECLKNRQGGGNRGNRDQDSSVASPDKAALGRASSMTSGGKLPICYN